MKIELILFAILQNFWSVEAGFFSFRYLLGWDFWLVFLICLGLSILDFNFYYYLIERLHQKLLKYSYFQKWCNKFVWSSYQKNSWVKYCQEWEKLGLFLTGVIPHLLIFGIAAQKLFRFKNGYWLLFGGNILKMIIVAYGFKFFEKLLGY